MLYRKYRPKNFGEVIGQDIIIKILKNFLKNEAQIPQGYLFTGQRGTGKTTTARIFAKALNCSDFKDEPCDKCNICELINKGHFLDLVEIDGASNNSVDDIRNLKEHIGFKPMQGKYKIFIIDEAHMLSLSAFNAFLKTLEEPPRGVIFVMATTEPEKIPATILSRVQRFDFRRATVKDIVKTLKQIAENEKIKIDDLALYLIAEESHGSFRDAEVIFEKLALYENNSGKITEELVEEFLGKLSNGKILEFLDLVFEKNIEKSLDFIREIYHQGFDIIIFNRSIVRFLRELLILKIHPNWKAQLERVYPEEILEKMINIAGKISIENLKKSLKTFYEADNLLKREPPILTLPIEMAIVELTV
ncbi:MAG: DNA polymerase III subunit gamma/tau [Patescibacteria group bacterium]